jgi:hypothetical protein
LIYDRHTGDDWTVNPVYTRYYDNLKVTAVLNWIKGLDHAGTTTVGVPTCDFDRSRSLQSSGPLIVGTSFNNSTLS